MSVLIKDLKIPRVGVLPCVVAVADNRILISDMNGNTLFEGEYAEVPTPHGRLIDADAFAKEVKRLENPEEPYQRGIVKAFLAGISCELTIIEAEGSE